jgi:hypothetical protein
LSLFNQIFCRQLNKSLTVKLQKKKIQIPFSPRTLTRRTHATQENEFDPPHPISPRRLHSSHYPGIGAGSEPDRTGLVVFPASAHGGDALLLLAASDRGR